MHAFTGPPQPVEVLHRGTWYRGELLGWRNEPDGRCIARVRCVVGKLRHSAWVGLADLRLPEPETATAPNPPIDLGPAAPLAPLPEAPRLPLLDGDTRPHELLPRRSPRRIPPPPPALGGTNGPACGARNRNTAPLPPPRAYQVQHQISA